MMEDIVPKEPKNFQYEFFQVKELFSELETDFYGRYNFREMQQ